MNKAKTFIILAFISCLVMALYLFVSRDQRTLRESIEQAPSQNDPRVQMSDFVLRRYDGSVKIGEFRAGQANFVAPNKVNVSARLYGWQRRENREELLEADAATFYFQSEHLMTLLSGAELDEATLVGDVRFEVNGYRLSTTSAVYLARQQVVRGQMPVQVEGNNRWFTAEKGFLLDLKDSSIDAFGKIRGMVLPVDGKIQ